MSEAGRPGPFGDVRVLEVSATPAGRIAGMLLADLGADVLRATRPAPGPGSHPDPGELCWDRGKRLVGLDAPLLRETARTADVLLVDLSPRTLRASGLGAEETRHGRPGLVHVWMPPYAARGEWSELPADHVLLNALGVAGRYPSTADRPVAPVVPTTTHVHGALGAAAAAAGLAGRRRLGTGSAAVVGGLHATAAQMATMMAEGVDGPVFMPGASGRPVPFWRAYRGADGLWFFLAALTPEIFFRALDALDRMDILVLPEVAGEFANILVEDAGGGVVNAELEALFATRPARHWLDVLEAGGVPCAPVRTREEWITGDVVAAEQGTVTRKHRTLGEVVMPGVPVVLTGTPGAAGGIAAGAEPSGAAPEELWTAPGIPAPASAGGGDEPVLPLAGLRVIDLSTFLAGPFAASLLADFGADVVKVEPVAGDPYRGYPVAYLAVNQRKRCVVLDLTRPDGAGELRALVRNADVLVENFRPGRLDRLGLGPGLLRGERPELVHCTVSAFGQNGRHAESRGFDPLLQSLSGMAAAQGGDGEPVMSSMPAHDTCTGALSVVGVLAAVYARGATGPGQRVLASLAATSTFLQSAEFTLYRGRPEPMRGGRDFPGPTPGNRYYSCADGWIAVAATTGPLMSALLAALEVSEPGEIERAFQAQPLDRALSLLAGRGVPACRVVQRKGALDDPFLLENGFSHIVRDATLGRIRVVRGYAEWHTDEGRAEGLGKALAPHR